MRANHKPCRITLYVIASLTAAALAWPFLHRSGGAATVHGPLPLTSDAAAAALGYAAAIDDASRFLCLTGKKVAMLGDSQTYHIFNHLTRILGDCASLKVGSRCGDLEYLRMIPKDLQVDWQNVARMGRDDGEEGPGVVPGTPLPEDDEGPVAYGLQNLGHGCRDCSGVSD